MQQLLIQFIEKLKNDTVNRNIEIMSITKSCTVTPRQSFERIKNRQNIFNNYFSNCKEISIPFDQFKLYHISGHDSEQAAISHMAVQDVVGNSNNNNSNSNTNSIDTLGVRIRINHDMYYNGSCSSDNINNNDDETFLQISPIVPKMIDEKLIGAVIAVTNTDDPDSLINCNIIAFYNVLNVDNQKQIVTCLCNESLLKQINNNQAPGLLLHGAVYSNILKNI